MSVAFERFDETPSRVGLAVTMFPAALAVAAAATTPGGLVVSAIGAVVVVGGVGTGSRTVVTVGTIALFGGVLLAGVGGASILQVCLGAAAAIVAWDAGTNALGVAGQLGADAATTRLLIVHTFATSIVALAISVGALAIYWLSRGGEPTTAVALLLLATLVFVLLLDR